MPEKAATRLQANGKGLLIRLPDHLVVSVGHLEQVPLGQCSRLLQCKTVAKPLSLSRLGLRLSGKKIPQVVEKFESGVKPKELLERVVMRPRQVNRQGSACSVIPQGRADAPRSRLGARPLAARAKPFEFSIENSAITDAGKWE